MSYWEEKLKMRECERASVRVAIKKANKTNNFQVGFKSIDEWANRMKDSNVDVEYVKLCYGKYVKRKELEKQKVLKWTRAMQERVYYMYAIHKQDEYWKESKFCVNYLLDLLEGKTKNITPQKNQEVLNWVNDKIIYTVSVDCVKNKNLKICKESLKYLKNLLEKVEGISND